MAALLLLVACGASVDEAMAPVAAEVAPVALTAERCNGNFIAHTLAHTTDVPGGNDVRMFEANGGGVAINDLDGDGDLDIVLANHAGPNSILWNDGDLQFRREPLGEGDARAANIIDLDDDGRLDIIFTRTSSAPNFWHNMGDGIFMRELLPGVDKPLYAINWADLDRDGDLDFVAATYDAALLANFGHEFLSSNQAGVYVYTNDEGTFRAQRLAEQAQALALALVDLNGDGRLDIQVGNDFAVPDFVWYWSDEGWLAQEPYDTTTHSTMSLDFADIDNNGQRELFASDMHPYQEDSETMAAWDPVMSSMMDDPHPPDDPQTMANVLQMADGAGWHDAAAALGVNATGWSWSSKFGDLDQDGFVDLYVVNGFMEQTTFAHLPDHELVEENQALRNEGGTGFAPMPRWNLGATASGRGMSMADLDGDGDLDIVVNNLRAPAQLFENQLCGGHSLQVDLFWPGSGNERAIGAALVLHSEEGSYYRDLKAASGYLSGDPARVHFGLPAGTNLTLEIIWPDGLHSTITDLPIDSLVTVTRP
ncbi:MAG: CRTAC1 family protein [Anaerolineales bacterium]|nr:CRTAC1 family protein [Anaerolineales bacterium]